MGAQTQQYWNGHDTRIYDEFLKICMTRFEHDINYNNRDNIQEIQYIKKHNTA